MIPQSSTGRDKRSWSRDKWATATQVEGAKYVVALTIREYPRLYQFQRKRGIAAYMRRVDGEMRVYIDTPPKKLKQRRYTPPEKYDRVILPKTSDMDVRIVGIYHGENPTLPDNVQRIDDSHDCYPPSFTGNADGVGRGGKLPSVKGKAANI